MLPITGTQPAGAPPRRRFDPWQTLARHILFPLHARWEGSVLPRDLQELEASQWWSPEQLKDLQTERARDLLRHAYRYCPFYRERFDDCGFNPEAFVDMSDLEVIPPLTKADIRLRRDEIVATSFSCDDLVPDKTGGSTGQPLHFYMDSRRLHSRLAAAYRHDRWTGWDIGHKVAYLWGHRGDQQPPSSLLSRLRVRFLDRTMVLDTSSIDKELLASFRRDLQVFDPLIYVAYANSVYLYARFLEESGQRDFHRPQAIVTSAEFLDPARREVIERVFSCPVFDRYGSRETSVIASQCECRGLHVCAESVHLEFLRGGVPTAVGTAGKIVVTDLLNRGMPLIRYEIGDVGAWSPETCSCGRGLPLMELGAGRVTDFLATPDGRIVSGASLTIYLIANAPGVAQAQLVQKRRGHLLIRIVRGDDFGEDTRRFFAAEIPRFFGVEMDYELEFVPEILPEASGKYRFSISEVDPSELF